MEFILLGKRQLKIILDEEDMEELAIAYDQLDYADPGTKEALIYLLDCAKEEVGFHPRNARLLVEAYPNQGDGCVLYVTAVPKSSSAKDLAAALEPVVFEFDEAEHLTDGACQTFARYSHRILKSSLYRFRGRYRMIVYPLDYTDRLSVFFLSEFGTVVGEGELLCAYVREHGDEIIADTAIDTLAKHFAPDPWQH